jgi:hypothetical protein
MATVHRPPARLGRALAGLTLLAVVLAEVLLPRVPVAAGRPSGDLVPLVVAAYGQAGTLAVALAHQRLPGEAPAMGPRGHRTAGFLAHNGAADRPFPAASMVKLYMAADILHRNRTGEIRLDRNDFALLQDMIRRSSDPAASTLWVRFGGGRMVTDVAVRFGLTGTAPPAVRGQWGEATTTARDLARFLSLLPTVAHPDDAATLLGWMRTATPLAADGFDQQFGVFGTAPPLTAVKQGWMCCLGGKRHLHSVGVVGSRVVVLLSEVPRAIRYDEARAALTAAAAALPPPPAP